ncbi:MAG: GTP-binding protein, partial [Coriobacteriia bacterium]|nr:GTP-binding protein [Coriobacteriia bacterium]
IRRKSLIDEDVEYYGFVRAMRAIDRAQVALLVIDSTIGLTDQDQRVANFAAERGCAIIVMLNKWDVLESLEEKDAINTRVSERLGFIGYAPVLKISALTGKGVDKIWAAVDNVYGNYTKTISTSQLNKLLTEMRDFGHTVSKGKQTLRVNYVTQTRVSPPGFTFFANHPMLADDNFKRYVENRMRDAFDLTGTPIIMKFRKKD